MATLKALIRDGMILEETVGPWIIFQGYQASVQGVICHTLGDARATVAQIARDEPLKDRADYEYSVLPDGESYSTGNGVDYFVIRKFTPALVMSTSQIAAWLEEAA